MNNLPVSDPQLISITRDEFENTLGKSNYPDAAFRYGWALIHSPRKEDVALGRNLIEELLARIARQSASSEAAPPQGPTDRELGFTLSVAYFKLKDFVTARRTLRDLLEKYPESAQARNLLEDVEDALVKEGLITAGVATGALVVGGVILGAILGGSRRS